MTKMTKIEVDLSDDDAQFIEVTAKILKTTPEKFLSVVVANWIKTTTHFMQFTPSQARKELEYTM